MGEVIVATCVYSWIFFDRNLLNLTIIPSQKWHHCSWSWLLASYQVDHTTTVCPVLPPKLVPILALSSQVYLHWQLRLDNYTCRAGMILEHILLYTEEFKAGSEGAATTQLFFFFCRFLFCLVFHKIFNFEYTNARAIPLLWSILLEQERKYFY